MLSMKKLFVSLLTLVLFAGFMYNSTPTVQAGFNELPLTVSNNGFEEPLPVAGITGWTLVHSGGVASVSDDQQYRGVNSLKLADSSASMALSMESDKIAALTGMVYEAEAQVYAVSGSARLYLRFWDQALNILGSSYTASSETELWEEVNVSETAPVGTKFVSV
ncbi:MAG: hypothetical protein K0R67_2123, partial [Paenibacillus sp.]|nr:hypothetical protein [Paenibacillus sp.]